MKHTIKVSMSERQRVREVEVDLPMYRYMDSGGDDYTGDHYMMTRLRSDGGLETVDLHRSSHRGRVSWEIEVVAGVSSGDEDYVLGRAEHALTAEHWAEKLREFKAWLAEIGL